MLLRTPTHPPTLPPTHPPTHPPTCYGWPWPQEFQVFLLDLLRCPAPDPMQPFVLPALAAALAQWPAALPPVGDGGAGAVEGGGADAALPAAHAALQEQCRWAAGESRLTAAGTAGTAAWGDDDEGTRRMHVGLCGAAARSVWHLGSRQWGWPGPDALDGGRGVQWGGMPARQRLEGILGGEGGG